MWEYKLEEFNLSNYSIHKLNELGEQGWEVVQWVDYKCLLKRVKRNSFYE